MVRRGWAWQCSTCGRNGNAWSAGHCGGCGQHWAGNFPPLPSAGRAPQPRPRPKPPTSDPTCLKPTFAEVAARWKDQANQAELAGLGRGVSAPTDGKNHGKAADLPQAAQAMDVDSSTDPEDGDRLHKLWQAILQIFGPDDPRTKTAESEFREAQAARRANKPLHAQLAHLDRRTLKLQKQVERHEATRLEAQTRLEAAQKDLATATSALAAAFAELESVESEKRAATAKEVGLPEDGTKHRTAEEMLRFLGMPAKLAVEHKAHLEAWMREVRTIVAGIQAPTETTSSIPKPPHCPCYPCAGPTVPGSGHREHGHQRNFHRAVPKPPSARI